MNQEIAQKIIQLMQQHDLPARVSDHYISFSPLEKTFVITKEMQDREDGEVYLSELFKGTQAELMEKLVAPSYLDFSGIHALRELEIMTAIKQFLKNGKSVLKEETRQFIEEDARNSLYPLYLLTHPLSSESENAARWKNFFQKIWKEGIYTSFLQLDFYKIEKSAYQEKLLQLLDKHKNQMPHQWQWYHALYEFIRFEESKKEERKKLAEGMKEVCKDPIHSSLANYYWELETKSDHS